MLAVALEVEVDGYVEALTDQLDVARWVIQVGEALSD
jgi:hypothetical protein